MLKNNYKHIATEELELDQEPCKVHMEENVH